MKSHNLLMFLLFIIILASCSTEAIDKKVVKKESTDKKIVAKVDNLEITQGDIDYGLFRAKLIEKLINEKSANQNDNITNPDKATQKSVLTELIKLYSLELLASEKKITVSENELNGRVSKVKKELAASPVFQKTISTYGENRFWKKEKERYRQIITVEKMVEILKREEKQKNPQYDEQTLVFNARQSIEDLAVDQIQKLSIKIY